jgi:hypothetical protein
MVRFICICGGRRYFNNHLPYIALKAQLNSARGNAAGEEYPFPHFAP